MLPLVGLDDDPQLTADKLFETKWHKAVLRTALKMGSLQLLLQVATFIYSI